MERQQAARLQVTGSRLYRFSSLLLGGDEIADLRIAVASATRIGVGRPLGSEPAERK